MKILDNRQNSGRSTATKVVGTPRFELGTPCTPCEQSLADKCLNDIGNHASIPSRNDVESASLSPCLAEDRGSDSGRRAAYLRAHYQSAKRNARIPKLLSQPALLTDRIQPLRRPTLRLKKP